MHNPGNHFLPHKSYPHPKMKHFIIYPSLLVFFLTLVYCSGSHERESLSGELSVSGYNSYPGYQEFPSGYGYLQIEDSLKSLNPSDIGFIRRHGWNLWAGIMQPAAGADSTWPIWYTWPTGTQIFQQSSEGSKKSRHRSLIHINSLNQPSKVSFFSEGMVENAPILDTVTGPNYKIPTEVIAKYDESVFIYGNPNDSVIGIQDGSHFAFNGDIMIVTESFSEAGYNWILENNLNKQSELASIDSLYRKDTLSNHNLNSPDSSILTKHMFWPVLEGQLSALPVWKNNFDSTYRSYAGYEMWNTIVAVDPENTGQQTAAVSYLHGITDPHSGKTIGPVAKKNAPVHDINEFYYHRVSQSDWNSFDEKDKAIINAASYWAYNDSFGVGDYLITIAMHINTKEIPTWGLQSVWWSDQPDIGQYAANRPSLPNAIGPWDHYLLTSAYGIPNANLSYNVSMNPYIELAIHPVATNCYNCH